MQQDESGVDLLGETPGRAALYPSLRRPSAQLGGAAVKTLTGKLADRLLLSPSPMSGGSHQVGYLTTDHGAAGNPPGSEPGPGMTAPVAAANQPDPLPLGCPVPPPPFALGHPAPPPPGWDEPAHLSREQSARPPGQAITRPDRWPDPFTEP